MKKQEITAQANTTCTGTHTTEGTRTSGPFFYLKLL